MEELKERYRAGTVGDVEVKKRLASALNAFLNPIRERRVPYEQRPELVREALIEGSRRARKVAAATMAEVREKMGILYFGGA